MKNDKFTVKKILSALVGVLFVGMGVAFNNCAGLGNDSVGIVYDGIRNAGGMSTSQLGIASNIVNLTLIALLVLIGRRYVSVGTLIYILPYGYFVDIGNVVYRHLAGDGLASRIIFSVTGCLLLCMGVAVYIAADIGVDPFTGIVLVIKDKLNKEYRYVKIGFDIAMIVLGMVLGGKPGVVTVITAVSLGPVIQFFTGLVEKYWLNSKKGGFCDVTYTDSAH
ncbi:MAG: hypothetical protein Q4C61_06345 [Lachnospiraceae bacterium]|nr:hypothetical protein [Lachnospiraceae bacterium]